ncbi:MAG: hypothetical protein ABSB38_09095 [Dehalococcoidia bacterium]|jgi:hypothetical protein
MDVGALPIVAWSFVTGLATIGTLLFARISIERAEKDKNDHHLRMGFAASILILLSFLINIWWRIYVTWGISDLIGAIIVSIIPLAVLLFYLRYRSKWVFIIPICVLAFLFFLLSAIIAFQLMRS